MLDISTILQYPLKADQYVPTDCSALKKIIVLHHTAGGHNPYAVVDYWNSTAERVGTPFVIGGTPAIAGQKPDAAKKTWADGSIVQCFSSKYYDYHIYMAQPANKIDAKYKTFAHDMDIAKQAIGIEICNWGFLTQKDGKFYSYTNQEVPAADIIEYPTAYRGSKFYHKYTDAQVAAVCELVTYLCDKYGIPKDYNDDIFEINERALSGQPGIYTHSSFRSDKADIHPQPNLIAALKNL